MSLKLSVFTTVTDPDKRGDNWKDAFACYRELADEVIVINGSAKNAFMPSIQYHHFRYYNYAWPQEFNWPTIGKHFQRGYERSTGDWVIHADLDFIFHEQDFATLRKALELNNDAPAISLWKYQFILPDRYNLKSRLVIAVNKGVYGDRIRFDSGGDLCQPSLDGVELIPDHVPEARVAFYNYEKMTKNREQITNDVGRMARAWDRHFKDKKLGYDDDGAYREWFNMVSGRFQKPQEHIKLEAHPKYVQDTISKLRPEQWGYSGFEQLGINNYVKGEGNA
jgi:hypothetical protein